MVELPERQPSEWRNHWARADSPMQEAHRELEKLVESGMISDVMQWTSKFLIFSYLAL